MSVLWDPNHPKYYNKLHELFPATTANNWWITARSLFAGRRAVLSEPTPRVEQNPALLRYSRLLKSGRGLRHNWNQVNGKLFDSRMRTLYIVYDAVCTVHSLICNCATAYESSSMGGCKIKVKFSLEQATKAQRGSRGIALLFL
jgi:hypothetical protein